MMRTSGLRESCRGRAETIINSESFDGIQDWDTFKRQLRRKFRGTYSASDFFKVLYDHGMTERQAPMDFFLEVEASVFQGYRDHRGAVGEPSELIRRVFLAGLPSTLRDLLVLKDDCSPIQLAETAQKLWNSRYGIRHSSSKLATSLRTTSKRTTTSFDVALQTATRTRDRYDLFPVATSPPPTQSPLSSPPTSRRNVWCEYHRSSTHSTRECRAAARQSSPPAYSCFRCGRSGHMSLQTEPVQTTAAVTTPAVGGRPVVALSVDGKTLLCFIDTGSQVTLVKPSALEVLDPAKKLRHHASSKILQGVSREPFHPAAEVILSFTISPDLVLLHRTIVADLSFHGDVLLGTDFLRRQDFTLQSEAQSPHGLLILGGCELSLLYTDAHSLQISLGTRLGTVTPLGEVYSVPHSTSHHVQPQSTFRETAARNHVPPVRTGPEDGQNKNYTAHRSTGIAAAGRDRCPISSGCTVPQGLSSLSTSALTEPRSPLQAGEESPFITASAVTEPKHFAESFLSPDGAIEPEMEWDDFSASLWGNSEEWDIEDAFLPPSVAVATCEAVTDDDDPGPDDPDVPDLDAEDSVGPSQDPDVEDVDADADPADPAPDTDVEDVDADGPIADVRADFTGGPDDDVTPCAVL
ncbi:hypothetical protein C7M84_022504 [Penaeus vannamei]|uniref:Peptidase A2 domain-containing protein n=1 Tax=Penaeus vannamei TaxID=6689 RepID=A0A3R7Q2H5_PENVA|nr:hypothetical protein C7M84_022504 [Penaeus vannamei]